MYQSVSVSPRKRTPTAEVAGTVWNQPFVSYHGWVPLPVRMCVLYERTGKTETYLKSVFLERTCKIITFEAMVFPNVKVNRERVLDMLAGQTYSKVPERNPKEKAGWAKQGRSIATQRRPSCCR